MKKLTIFIILIIFFSIAVIYKSNTDSPDELTGRFIYEEENEEIQPELEEQAQQEPPIIESPSAEDLPIPETANEQVDMVSRAKCIDDRIELMFTNPSNQTLTFVKDIIVKVNGMVVADPECNILTIKPKRKALCTDISGHLPIKEGKKNLVQLSTKQEDIELIVDCGNQ